MVAHYWHILPSEFYELSNLDKAIMIEYYMTTKKQQAVADEYSRRKMEQNKK